MFFLFYSGLQLSSKGLKSCHSLGGYILFLTGICPQLVWTEINTVLFRSFLHRPPRWHLMRCLHLPPVPLQWIHTVSQAKEVCQLLGSFSKCFQSHQTNVSSILWPHNVCEVVQGPSAHWVQTFLSWFLMPQCQNNTSERKITRQEVGHCFHLRSCAFFSGASIIP